MGFRSNSPHRPGLEPGPAEITMVHHLVRAQGRDGVESS